MFALPGGPIHRVPDEKMSAAHPVWEGPRGISLVQPFENLVCLTDLPPACSRLVSNARPDRPSLV